MTYVNGKVINFSAGVQDTTKENVVCQAEAAVMQSRSVALLLIVSCLFAIADATVAPDNATTSLSCVTEANCTTTTTTTEGAVCCDGAICCRANSSTLASNCSARCHPNLTTCCPPGHCCSGPPVPDEEAQKGVGRNIGLEFSSHYFLVFTVLILPVIATVVTMVSKRFRLGRKLNAGEQSNANDDVSRDPRTTSQSQTLLEPLPPVAAMSNASIKLGPLSRTQ